MNNGFITFELIVYNFAGLAWFSPDCTHFSKAKGKKPVKKYIRGLAWIVIKWAKAVKPRIIMLRMEYKPVGMGH